MNLRFSTLLAAVLASSVVAFSVVYLALPSTWRLHAAAVQPCLKRPGGEAAGTAWDTMRPCLEPLFHGQAAFVALGLLAQIVVAGLIFVLHPRRLTRRRRLTPLTGPDNADLLRELDDLAGAAGLARRPRWLLDPYAATSGGQAFGLPGRRAVCLDVGLLVRFGLDLAGFRAVVRHELAHLRNRDIDRTYLTVAVWWSFVLVALAPFVVLSLNPALLRRPLSLSSATVGESPAVWIHRLVALVVLTLVVLLARNAVLRARELHADVTASRWDTDGALARVVACLPWPGDGRRWPVLRARLGTHPAPGLRLRTMADPGRLSRPSVATSIVLGLTAGLGLSNVSLLAGNLLGDLLVPGLALLSLTVGAMLVGTLATAVRGTGLGRTAALSMGSATGLAAAGPLALQAGDLGLTGVVGDRADVLTLALTSALIMAGGLLVGFWSRSVTAALDQRQDLSPVRRHRYRAVATGTVIAVAAPLFALWYVSTFGGFLTLVRPGALPDAGRSIGWYVTLAEWVGSFNQTRHLLLNTPVASVGLVLLWLVPAMLLRWDRRLPAGAGQALRIGALCGSAMVVAGLLLPYAARAALPVEVRHLAPGPPEESAGSFDMIYHQTYVACAVVAQAVAAALVAARGHLRPVFVPLAVTFTAILATAGLYAGSAVSSCIDLIGTSCKPVVAVPDSHAALHLTTILTWGAAATGPAAALGAAVGALRRRSFRRRAVAVPPAVVAGRWPVTALLAVTALVVPAAAAARVPAGYGAWMPDPGPAPALPPEPDPPPRRSVADPCLTGSWRETSRWSDAVVVGTEPARYTGTGGAVQHFRADGTVLLDFGAGLTETAVVDGDRIDVHQAGRVTAAYRAVSGTIDYLDETVRGTLTVTVRIEGKVIRRAQVVPQLSDDKYTCRGGTLRMSPADPLSQAYEIKLRQVSNG